MTSTTRPTVDSACSVCSTGKYPSFSMGANLCERHNVCISCGIKRSQLDHTPWGAREGAFQCAPCEKSQRNAAIKKRISEGFEHSYTDEVVCPHCGYTYGDSWEMGDGEKECPDCDKTFNLERNVSLTYITTKLENEAT